MRTDRKIKSLTCRTSPGVYLLDKDKIVYRRDKIEGKEYITQCIVPKGATVVVPYDSYFCYSNLHKMRTNMLIPLFSIGITYNHGYYKDISKYSNILDKINYQHNGIRKFNYKRFKLNKPNRLDYNQWKSCSNGLHFFTTLKEAINF